MKMLKSRLMMTEYKKNILPLEESSLPSCVFKLTWKHLLLFLS